MSRKTLVPRPVVCYISLITLCLLDAGLILVISTLHAGSKKNNKTSFF